MMPLWLSVGLCALAWSSGAFFGVGVLERRVSVRAVAPDEKAERPHRRRSAVLARYRRPIVYGSLVGSLVVFVWLVTSLFLSFGAGFTG